MPRSTGHDRSCRLTCSYCKHCRHAASTLDTLQALYKVGPNLADILTTTSIRISALQLLVPCLHFLRYALPPIDSSFVFHTPGVRRLLLRRRRLASIDIVFSMANASPFAVGHSHSHTTFMDHCIGHDVPSKATVLGYSD